MKIAVVILVIVVAIVGGLWVNSRREYQELTLQSKQTIASARNETLAAQVEVQGVQTQLQAQVERAATLEKNIQSLAAEKNAAQQEAQQLKTRADMLQATLVAEEAKLASTDAEKTKLLGQLGGVSNKLVSVEKQLADLEKSNTATEAQLKTLRGEHAALEMEKNSLVRQLNDLDSLKAQIRLVRGERWQKRIAEWKRRDDAGSASGNHGLLFTQGAWQTKLPAFAP